VTVEQAVNEDSLLPSEQEGGEESLEEAAPEIDLDEDPFQFDSHCEPGPDWEASIRKIRIRTMDVPTAEEQRARIREIIGILEGERDEPSQRQVEESEK
jgi:hypothetical protein